MDSVGDLARALVLRTNQVRLRNEMDTLAVEVSTGLVKDPAKALGGDISGLTSLNRSLARLDTYRVNTSEAELLTGTMQKSLGIVQERSTELASSLLSAELTPTRAMTNSLAQSARGTLNQAIANLNQSVAGRFLFSGTQTDAPPVADIETFLAEASLAVAGQTTAEDIDAALDGFFATGGGFETAVYQGSNTGLSPFPIGEGDAVNIDFRATDQEMRALLKPMVLASLASDPALALDVSTQVELLTMAGVQSMSAQQEFTNYRARLGAAEGRVEAAEARNSSERSGLSIAKLNLIEADPYATAARFEDVRIQLESIYAITARSQRLSLTQFL